MRGKLCSKHFVASFYKLYKLETHAQFWRGNLSENGYLGVPRIGESHGGLDVEEIASGYCPMVIAVLNVRDLLQ